MKLNIHPQWYSDAQVVCSCGNTFTIGSTKKNIKVEICSKCHPFFTGEVRFVDTLGRVEKFQEKQKKAHAMESIIEAKKKKKMDQKEEAKKPRSLREMLLGA